MAQLKPRKILTAALGVATVSYVAGCGRTILNDEGRGQGKVVGADASVTYTDTLTGVSETPSISPVNPGSTISGNLMPPPQTSPTASVAPTSQVAPDTYVDPGTFISGNLMAPPYPSFDDWSTSPTEQTWPAESLSTAPTGAVTTAETSPPGSFDTQGTGTLPTDLGDASVLDGGEAPSTETQSESSTALIDAGIIISGNLLPPPMPDADAGSQEQ